MAVKETLRDSTLVPSLARQGLGEDHRHSVPNRAKIRSSVLVFDDLGLPAEHVLASLCSLLDIAVRACRLLGVVSAVVRGR
jgi:hypothetical protein